MFDRTEEAAAQAAADAILTSEERYAITDPIKREDVRHERFLHRVLLPFCVVGLIIVALVTIHNAQHALDEAAKGSIPPCSAYAFTSTPDLHGAREDACYTQNPDGGFTISTGAGVETAGY